MRGIQLNKALITTAALVLTIGIGARQTSAQAIYATPANSSDKDGSVDAQAAFTIDPINGQIHIDVTNLLKDQTSDGQSISVILFTVSQGPGNDTLTTPTATELTLNGSKHPDGTYSTNAGQSITHWLLQSAANDSNIEIGTLTDAKPHDLIIGAPGANGKYNNANASMLQHNPSVDQVLDLTLNVQGLTSQTTLSSVIFQFGTTEGSERVDGSYQSGSPYGPAVPEPAFYQMSALMVLGGIGVLRLRRKARTQA